MKSNLWRVPRGHVFRESSQELSQPIEVGQDPGQPLSARDSGRVFPPPSLPGHV